MKLVDATTKNDKKQFRNSTKNKEDFKSGIWYLWCQILSSLHSAQAKQSIALFHMVRQILAINNWIQSKIAVYNQSEWEGLPLA